MENININRINEIIKLAQKYKNPRKIDDKFIVVHPKNFKLINECLKKEEIIIDVYDNIYCDIDKIYLIEKPIISL